MKSARVEEFKKLARRLGVHISIIGNVLDKPVFTISKGSKYILSADLSLLRDSYNSLERVIEGGV